MMPIIAFRVDSSNTIGTGHVARCLTLADVFRIRGAHVVFICRDLPGNSILQIRHNNFEVKVLPYSSAVTPVIVDSKDYVSWLGVSLEEEITDSIAVLSSFKIKLLVVDHYGLDLVWENKLAKFTEKLLVIDDLANRGHTCDFLVDQTLGQKSSLYEYLVPKKCVVLAGSKYALLRPEFRERRLASIARRKTPVLKRILVSMGGIDRLNSTCAVLDGLNNSNLSSMIKVNVVMGSNAPHLCDVVSYAQDSRFDVAVRTNVSNMGELLCESDLAIGAGGSSSWERCCLGVPSIVIATADNQLDIIQKLAETGSAKTISSTVTLALKLTDMINNLVMPDDLVDLSLRSSSATDGFGAELVINEVL